MQEFRQWLVELIDEDIKILEYRNQDLDEAYYEDNAEKIVYYTREEEHAKTELDTLMMVLNKLDKMEEDNESKKQGTSKRV